MAALAGSQSQVTCSAHWQTFTRTAPPLNDVVALSARDVWAVGGSTGGITSPVVYRPVIVHWDGRAIQKRLFPWKRAQFVGVDASSPTDVWAVGSSSISRRSTVPLVAHWDGSRWQRVGVPPVTGGGALHDVTAIAPDDVWAAGEVWASDRPLLIHWDGRRWHQVDLGRVSPRLAALYSIDSLGSGNVWAAGGNRPDSSGYGYGPVFLHLEGSRWREVSSGYGPAYWMHDFGTVKVTVGRSGDVWGVHQSYEDSAVPQFVVWRGPRARRQDRIRLGDVPGIEPGVRDIAVISPTNVWLVGDVQDRDYTHWFPLIVHRDGTAWRISSTPFSRLADTAIGAISAISDSDIWAVGDHLIVRYSC